MAATKPLDEAIGEEWQLLLSAASADAYRAYLARIFGFVAPLERALSRVPDLASYIHPRRFAKHELLRRDLEALGIRAEELPVSSAVPPIEDAQRALGWAYIIERNTLGHTTLFHSLAAVLPGEAAFASAYLKCYFGAVGETWRTFDDALVAAGANDSDADRIVIAAQHATACYVQWSTSTTMPIMHPSAHRFAR